MKRLAALSPEHIQLLQQRLSEKGLRIQGDSQIPCRAGGEDCPLSFAQERLWFLTQLEPDNPFYNIPLALRLQGPLDFTALSVALNALLARHEALRTSFVAVGGHPVQRIQASLSITPSFINLRDHAEVEQQKLVREWLHREMHTPFDLRQAPLLRLRLLQLDAQEHFALFTLHHIVADGWSLGILVRELSALYAAARAGQAAQLRPLPVQYPDYALWQRRWLTEEVLDKQLSYWQQRMHNAPPHLLLPTDRPRTGSPSYRGNRRARLLPGALLQGLRQLNRREGVTMFMTLLAAFQVLLARYTGQSDVVVGTPVAGRTRTEVEGLIGFFVNTLVLRVDLAGGPTCRQLLERVREAVLGAFAHQDVPFEKVVEALRPERQSTRQPLFNILFAFQNGSAPVPQLDGLTVSVLDMDSPTAKFDLDLLMVEEAEALTASLAYDTDLFDDTTVIRWLSHIQILIEAIAADPDQRITDLPLLTPAERHQLLVEWNDTAADYPAQCLHRLFEVQVELTPEAIALVFEGQRLTYRELNRLANQLASYLQSLGVGPERRVAVCLDRSIEMIVALLAILKAGGAYVPIELTYPHDRMSYILRDTSAAAVITRRELLNRLPQIETNIVCLDPDFSLLGPQPVENLNCAASVDNLAYSLYTSGSTGQPKAVMIEHGSLTNYLWWCSRNLMPDPAQTLPVTTRLTFDASLKQMFVPLLRGGEAWLIPEETITQPEALLAALAQRNLVAFNCVPLLWQTILDAVEATQLNIPAGLKSLFIGGEQLSPELASRSLAKWPHLQIWNVYGPTETTANASCSLVSGQSTISIGRPIANTQIYLLDENMQPVPVGVAGELYIGGTGAARGYLNHPELTAAGFVPDPFNPKAGSRLYKTGDLARYRPDGNIEFLGRIDRQVKLRGFRLELGEIEAALNQHSNVRACAVAVWPDESGGKRLIAYVVARQEPKPANEELFRFLQERLPDYMLPAAFIRLEELPLLVSGKPDRKALPDPAGLISALERELIPPRNMVEELLIGIWGQVLGLKQLSIQQNFFQLGGHSLLATQIISRVREVFKVELPLRSLFEAPTVASFSRHVEESLHFKHHVQMSPLKRAARDSDIPLSYAQQRLWFIDQLEPDSPLYNIPVALRLQGQLDIAAFEQALNEVLRRHEVLRTTFVMANGRPVQKIAAQQAIALPIVDLSFLSEADRESSALRMIEEEAHRPFSLEQGPLLRVKLFRLGENDHVVLLIIHHIISDGWSMNILIHELAVLYGAFSRCLPSPLPELPIQYADFTLWQRELLQGATLQTQLDYWRKQLADVPPTLELPFDHQRPAIQSTHGAIYSFELSHSFLAGLTELSRQRSVTLFMTLLAAFQALLHRYTQQTDICTGTPIAGRTRTETELLIGCFINLLALRADLWGNPPFLALLDRVREAALGAYGHQDLPFEKLIEELHPERSLSHQPLFQVTFRLNNTPAAALELPGLTLTPFPLDTHTAKFDLSLVMTEHATGLTAIAEYNTDLFDAGTITRFCDHFRLLLEDIVARPNRHLSELSLQSEAERQQLLGAWNETTIPFSLDDESKNNCIHQQIEQQVTCVPDRVALTSDGQTLTYAALNDHANRLAYFLRNSGVGAETRVALCLERSPELIVGILGILKAGGAYVPIGPDSPTKRIEYMLRAADARVLLTRQGLTANLPSRNAQVICLDTIGEDWRRIAESSKENPPNQVSPDNPAYVIFTSGSTGHPKGVMIEHKSLWHSTRARAAYYQEPVGNFLLVSPAHFDSSVAGIFWTLACGGTLVLPPEDYSQDLSTIIGLLDELQISHLLCLPSLYQFILKEAAPDGLRNLKLVIVAGEVCPAALVVQHRQLLPNTALYNEYGPTESTVWATVHRCDGLPHGSVIPIGRPIANAQIYLLDPYLQPTPVGAIGELYLGGAGLARGYLNRPDLTADRFQPDPFSSAAGARLYRTGDLARYRSGGSLLFAGRADEQVKVRGYRIEPGEIEAVLRHLPQVAAAAVVSHSERSSAPQLVAYIVPQPETTLDRAEIRQQLLHQLPDYMVPSVFVSLERLPLTPTGKLDRRALPPPERSATIGAREFILPRTPTEQAIAEIWAQILGCSPIGIHDNFFDLGGHSLSATQVSSRLREVFQVELPLRKLFESTTVAELAEAVEQAQLELLQGPNIEDIEHLAGELEALSDDEAEALLLKEEEGEANE